MKKLAVLFLCAFLLSLAAGCKDKPGPVPFTVEAPDSVKGKWKGVVLSIEDLHKKEKSEQFIAIGSTYTVPDTNFSVTVNEFFPSFNKERTRITSQSNKLDNPAASLVVNDCGFEIFNGWVFGKKPSPAFVHARFIVMLKEGVPNK